MLTHLVFEKILPRVSIISFDQKTYGTAFSVPAHGVLYFITTSCLIEAKPKNKITFYIFENQQPRKITARCFLKEDSKLAILKTDIPANSDKQLILSSKHLIIGQDLYILGFPNDSKTENETFLGPFLKKVTLAAIQGSKLILDGSIPPGFSGGPVTFWDHLMERPSICGVYTSSLLKDLEVNRSVSTSTLDNIEDTGFSIAYNISPIKNPSVYAFKTNLFSNFKRLARSLLR